MIEEILNQIEPIYLIQFLITLFLAVLFLHSGIDKVVDWKGNLVWLKEHFSNSILKHIVPIMLAIITVLELIAGVLCLVGGIIVAATGYGAIAFIGVFFATVNILLLFFGQRLAKDYEGAAVLAGYFLLCIFGLYFLR